MSRKALGEAVRRLMMRVHPDRLTKPDAVRFKKSNETSLKQLNSFLDTANAKYLGRKDVISNHQERYVFCFHIEDESDDSKFLQISKSVTIPNRLYEHDEFGEDWMSLAHTCLAGLLRQSGVELPDGLHSGIKLSPSRRSSSSPSFSSKSAEEQLESHLRAVGGIEVQHATDLEDEGEVEDVLRHVKDILFSPNFFISPLLREEDIDTSMAALKELMTLNYFGLGLFDLNAWLDAIFVLTEYESSISEVDGVVVVKLSVQALTSCDSSESLKTLQDAYAALRQ